MRTSQAIMRTGHLRTALVILLAAVALCMTGASAGWAVEDTATQDDATYDTRRECRDARPLDTARFEWECSRTDTNVWVGERIMVIDSFGTPSTTRSSGGGGFLALLFIWSGIPLIIAATMASNRDESMGMAVLLTLFLGWIGLAIVYFGQERTTSTVRGLAAVGQDRASASSPQNRDVPPTRAEVAWPSSSRPDTDDATGRLQKLEELRDQGLITDTEYAGQRQRILDNI